MVPPSTEVAQRVETALSPSPHQLYELSFRSIEPLLDLHFYAHRVDLRWAISPSDLPAHLGRLARRLSRETRQPVLSHATEILLLSPQPLRPDDSFRVLATEIFNFSEPQHRRFLKQLLDQHTAQCFRQWKFKVDDYGKKAFFPQQHRITNEIEAQRFIHWEHRIDEQQHVILAIDYGNHYQDRLTLDQRDLQALDRHQPLSHTYDAKGCRFVRVADYTVSTPRPELGNISLLDYHQREGKIPAQTLAAIPPETNAILVDYGSFGKQVIFSHIPHLLKKAFSRDDIDSQTFKDRVFDINARFTKAIQRIQAFNQSPESRLIGQKLTFDTMPHCPQPQFNFAQRNPKNLDFGNGYSANFPVEALRQRRLLEKPDRISAIVLQPQGWNTERWCSSFTTFLREFGIELDIIHTRSYAPSPIDVQRQCRQLDTANFALTFVPDQDSFRSTPELDPYPVLKRELMTASLPSQAIEGSTLQAGFKPETGYNLLLGMLCKLGYAPWQLRDMPGDTQAFLGLDVGRKDGRAVGAAAFIVDRLGRVIGWSAVDFQAHRETFDLQALRRILFELIHCFEEAKQEKLHHLVIHRDGLLQADELAILEALIPELQAEGLQSLDVAEILKSGFDRAALFDSGQQKWINPRRGWAWPVSTNSVEIMTTGSTELKGSQNFVPRPITLRQRLGNTRLGILAAQAYWLSEMHIGSTQTVRLPITTYYADAAASAALDGLLPTGLRLSLQLPFV